MASLQQRHELFNRLRVSAALSLGLIALYAAFLTRTYYWDGVLFSFYIENVRDGTYPAATLFHPNHLLYSAIGYLLYEALPVRAITALQLLNVVCSAGTTSLLYVVADKLFTSRALTAFATLLFASGATWWKFSTDADAYIPAVLLVFTAVTLAVCMPRHLVLAGGCHALAMLIHQLSIFAFVPVLVAIAGTPNWRRRCTLYLAGTFASVASVYSAAFRFVHPNLPFWRWVSSFSGNTNTTRSLVQALVIYPASYLKLLAGGKLTLIRDFLSPVVVLALVAAVALAGCAFQQFRAPTTSSTPVPIDPRWKRVLWAWLLPYALFLLWFEPGNAFYKLFLWPPMVLLLAISISERRALLARSPGFLALAAALASWNFGAFIFPHSNTRADPVLQLAEVINRQMPKHATVYYRTFSPDDWYLAYFAPGRRWKPLPAEAYQLQTPTCLETTAWNARKPSLPMTSPEIAQHWELLDSHHHIQIVCLREKR